MKITVVLEALTGEFETDIDRAAKRAEKRMGEMQQTLVKGLKVTALAAAAAGVGFAALTKSQIDVADQFAKLSQSTGIAVETLSGLELAAELSGVSMEDMATALGRLARTASDAASGLKTAQEAFNALGINVKNADGTLKGLDQLLPEIADKFANSADGTAKAAVAQELFGRAGARLIPLLNKGSEGLEEFKKEAEELGLIVSGPTAAAAEEFNDNLTRLGFATKGIGRSIAAELLPGLVAITDSFVESAKEGGALDKVAGGVAFAFKGIISVVSGAVFVFEELGDSLGATFAQIGALVTLNFDEAGAIGDAFREEQLRRMEAFSARMETLWNGALSPPEDKPADGKPKRSIVIIDPEAAKAAEAAAKALAAEVDKARSDVLKLGEDSSDAWTKYEAGIKRVNEALSLHAVTAQEAQAALEQLEAERDEALDRQKGQLEELSSFADEAARSIQQSLSDFIFDPFDKGLDGMVEGFAKTVQRMAADAAAAALLEKLFGGQGVEGLFGSGGFGAFIGSIFGGARQFGGDIFPGHSYLVGEREPEIVVPRTVSKVVPLSQVGGRSIQQVFNIMTPDANSFRLSERQIMKRQRQRMAVAT